MIAFETLLRQTIPPATARRAYGTDPHQFGDLRLPAGAGPHPVVILLHGGFWRRAYDLTYCGALGADFAARGVATWNLEYRRVGQRGGGWPGTLADVAAGTDRLRDLATDYPLDLGRVAALGHSAGGQLALWLAARSRLPAGDDLRGAAPVSLRAAVALAGVVDLRLADDLGIGRDATADFMGGHATRFPERYARASPADLLPLGVPQTLIHGAEDDNVPLVISQRYAAAALAAGDDARLLVLPGAGHFELVAPWTPEWATVAATTLALLGA